MLNQDKFLEKVLRIIRRFIPVRLFRALQPWYHGTLALSGAFFYGLPGRKLKIIGVTGTKGKSTTVFLIARILEGAGKSVAAVGSLGFKVKERQWPNTLKMTMPGRWQLQKFLYQAVKAGCKYAVLEITSEGLAQNRHLGIQFDCAVFTNLHREHIEAHGSFEKYLAAKQQLFARVKNIHVINSDDPKAEEFSKFPANKTIFYGIKSGDMRAQTVMAVVDSVQFSIYGTNFSLKFGGEFNCYNALCALATVAMYGVDLPSAKPILERIKFIPGRMEIIQHKPFMVVVDYAHTPDSLEAVYRTLTKSRIKNQESRLICVLGAAAGGRDKWKRPQFGRIAARYCDEIILTNEDPYDENPAAILEEIAAGFSNSIHHPSSIIHPPNLYKILDRTKAIDRALLDAKLGDTVIITGKGSELTMALANGEKIPWSDKETVLKLLHN